MVTALRILQLLHTNSVAPGGSFPVLGEGVSLHLKARFCYVVLLLSFSSCSPNSGWSLRVCKRAQRDESPDTLNRGPGAPRGAEPWAQARGRRNPVREGTRFQPDEPAAHTEARHGGVRGLVARCGHQRAGPGRRSPLGPRGRLDGQPPQGQEAPGPPGRPQGVPDGAGVPRSCLAHAQLSLPKCLPRSLPVFVPMSAWVGSFACGYPEPLRQKLDNKKDDITIRWL